MKKYKKSLLVIGLILVAFIAFALDNNARATTLSQSSVFLNQGQSTTVYASNTSAYLFLSSNSNAGVASVSVSGNAISIYANAPGNTTAILCEGNGGICNTIYVVVNGYGSTNTNTLGLNISNLSLPIGGYATISSPNSSSLYVSNNSNSNIASAASSSLVPGCTATSAYNTITGHPCIYTGGTNDTGSITISGVSAGTDTITLCQSGGSSCSTIYVTVTDYSTRSYTTSYYSIPRGNTTYYPTQSDAYLNDGIPIIYSR